MCKIVESDLLQRIFVTDDPGGNPTQGSSTEIIPGPSSLRVF